MQHLLQETGLIVEIAIYLNPMDYLKLRKVSRWTSAKLPRKQSLPFTCYRNSYEWCISTPYALVPLHFVSPVDVFGRFICLDLDMIVPSQIMWLGESGLVHELDRVIQSGKILDPDLMRKSILKAVSIFFSSGNSQMDPMMPRNLCNNVNAMNQRGYTALHLSLHLELSQIVRLLVAAGADPTIALPNQQNALHHAVLLQNTEFIRLFDSPNLRESRDFLGFTPFLIACQLGNIGICQHLKEKGANIHTADNDGFTAMHYAVKKSFDLVIWMVELGISASIPSGSGITPLHCLFENCIDSSGRLLLRMSSLRHFELEDQPLFDLSKLLLDNGASINVQDSLSHTPLHIACQKPCKYFGRVIEMLLVNGADHSITDFQGNTPLHYAAIQKDVFICWLLLEYGADMFVGASTPWYHATKSSKHELFSVFVSFGARMDYTNEIGQSLLMQAVGNTDEKHVQMLLRRNVNINHQCDIGETALHLACFQENAELCEILLRNKADWQICDARGLGPFDYVCAEFFVRFDGYLV